MNNRIWVSMLGLVLVAFLVPENSAAQASRPNILLILVDDLGYSDVSPFGGEIPTPNIERLADEGLRFTNFHSAMKCNPTRAMLMSGLDNNIAAQGPRRSYHLRPDVPTIAERLAAAGYHTVMAGKWDLGAGDGQGPADRGFEKSFALLPGVSTHFRNAFDMDLGDDGTTAGYRDEGVPTAIGDDFYSTDNYTAKLIDYLDGRPDPEQPFFAYLSLTAPHYPLQAPAAAIEKFRGRYDSGYQAVRAARLERLVELGILDSAAQPWPADSLPDWGSLDESKRAYEARRMEVFAAMVWLVDGAVGRVLDYLEANSLQENTLVIFASDNGADGTRRGAGYDDRYDNRTENLGNADSFVTQGMNWATVSSTPWRLVKSYPTEGGTRVPMIARWPGRIDAGDISRSWFRMADLSWTFLDLADATPGADEQSAPLSGRSAMTTLLGGEGPYGSDEAVIHTYIERRLGGANVLRDGWKLVWWKEDGSYLAPKLFHLDTDPMEVRDLAAERPDILRQLGREWQAYRGRAGSGVDEAAAVFGEPKP